jgi:hypothetical protein
MKAMWRNVVLAVSKKTVMGKAEQQLTPAFGFFPVDKFSAPPQTDRFLSFTNH